MTRYLKDVTTLELFPDKCNGCGMCVTVCPHGVLELGGGLASIVDRDACMECGACVRNCPEEAIFVQTGVGCAQAVINSALGRTGTACCGLEDYHPSGPECAAADSGCGCEEAPRERRGSGCC